jgi:hypothetical protein
MEIESNMSRTTIVVDTSIRDKLKQYGVKGETYDDIMIIFPSSFSVLFSLPSL